MAQATTVTPAPGTPTQPVTPTTPPCPICGGPMRSNAAKLAEGKRVPLWTCQGSKWNATTKSDDGCKGVIWPKESGSTALAVQKPGAIAMTESANAPMLDFKSVPLPIMARAAAIAAKVLAEGGTINAAQALDAAYHFESTGEVMGRHSYVGTSGSVAGRVLEGYRAVARRLDMSQYQYRYRPLTADEKEFHSFHDGDRMLICELDVLAARRQCIEMGIPYSPILGISIVRKGDKLNDPAYRDPMWIMQKQARTDALRQVGETSSANEEIAEAEALGVDMQATRALQAGGAYLDQEQAETLVDDAVRASAQALISPEQQAAEQQAATAQLALTDLQRELGLWAYQQALEASPQPCPRCAAPFASHAHTVDCLFRLALPNAPLWPPEAEPEPEPELSPALTAVEHYRDILRQHISHTTPATARQKNWMLGALTLLDPDENHQNDLLAWAFGIPTIDELTAGQGEGLSLGSPRRRTPRATCRSNPRPSSSTPRFWPRWAPTWRLNWKHRQPTRPLTGAGFTWAMA
jgi:hypothetical protein